MKKIFQRAAKRYSLYRKLFLVFGLLLCVQLVWAAAQNFQKLVTEFQESAIADFIDFTNKGERYPLMHAISELRFRVFSEKLGINRKVETRACSLNRTYGTAVPTEQKKFCQDYDKLVELAKSSLVQMAIFEKIYLNAEPVLLREIERQRAREAVRVWIRQKIKCFKNKFSCGRDEQKLIKRVTNYEPEIIKTYLFLLQNLDKKLFPEEQAATFIQAKDLETLCGFVDEGSKKTEKPGMVLIHSGRFNMGSISGLPSEHPVREVLLKDFWIDKCEVTSYQFLQVAAEHPFLRKSTFPRKFHDGNYLKNWQDDLLPESGSELKPVIHVSWYAARNYCNYVGKRLVSEAEWEMAARAGIENDYSFEGGSELLPDHGWFRENSGGAIHSTAQKLSNPNGLFDIHGNVWEWVYDWFGIYSSVSETNPQGPETGKYRVLRGGSWNDPPEYLRSAMRRDALPTDTFNNVGFRCAVEE
ncbi:MAG: formylglycine-generating enzyme family protein [SAR324 cluster bacterium]|nr:formylglycine-generating enzyme family protein [SAR324 cluster bacterium]MBL7034875.1 formylglycine-generating enzyme family protein [SAR324 cluster bacterium]